jgi:hypothetical protein
MQRPKCACVHPDRKECLLRRLREPFDERDLDDDDRCDCCCHDEDEDGFTEWDEELSNAPES